MSFNNRSDALIELLEELTREEQEYVLVGAYAVSAFNAGFSTDLDLVVAPDSKAEFAEFLERIGEKYLPTQVCRTTTRSVLQIVYQ